MEEIWKPVPGFEGTHEVSSYGNIRSLKRIVTYKDGRKPREWLSVILKPFIGSSGYHSIDIKLESVKYRKQVHRLVAEAFISPCEGNNQVNHKDNNKLNNRADNLEWVTQSQNMRHAFDNGHHSGIGSSHYRAIRIKDLSTGKVYGSLSEAGDALGISKQSVYRICEGRQVSRFRLKKLS